MATEIRDAVHAAIRTNFPMFQQEITPATTALDVPGWDSTSHVQLMFLIEEMTGRTIDIGHTFGLKSIEDLVAYVESCA